MLCFILLSSSFILSAHAARIYPSAGSTSATFLKLPVGARAAALGGAFAGVPGDPYAVYWNPAGLASLARERNAGFFHNNYFQRMGQEFAYCTLPASGLSLPLAGRPKSGVFGFSLNYFYTPSDLERRSGLYESDPLNPISPVEGKFGAYDAAFTAAYGWTAAPGLSLGAGLKAIRQSVDTVSGDGAALDLGLSRTFNWKGADYAAGFSLQNLGLGIKLVSRRYGLPLVARAGLSRALPDGGLVVLEADKPVDNYPSFAAGVEYPLGRAFLLRTAYRYRLYGNELGAWSGFSTGAGVILGALTLDYAFSPFGELGNSHRFSVNFRFGAAPPAPPAAQPAEESKQVLFALTPQALSFSRQGMKYKVTAAAADCMLSTITFITLARSEVPAWLAAAEIPPSAESLKGLPAGLAPLAAWRLPALPGSVEGEVEYRFSVPLDLPGAGQAVFLCGDGKTWTEAPVSGRTLETGFYRFGVRAPPARLCALAAPR